MEQFYQLLNKKDETFKDFIMFMDYMIDQKAYKFEDEKLQQDFNYHFIRIPKYLRETMGKVRHEVIGDLADIGNVTTSASKRLDKLTKLD